MIFNYIYYLWIPINQLRPKMSRHPRWLPLNDRFRHGIARPVQWEPPSPQNSYCFYLFSVFITLYVFRFPWLCFSPCSFSRYSVYFSFCFLLFVLLWFFQLLIDSVVVSFCFPLSFCFCSVFPPRIALFLVCVVFFAPFIVFVCSVFAILLRIMSSFSFCFHLVFPTLNCACLFFVSCRWLYSVLSFSILCVFVCFLIVVFYL